MNHGSGNRQARGDIDRLVAAFFGAVSFEPGQQPQYERLAELMLAQGLLIHQDAAGPRLWLPADFIASRRATYVSGLISRYRVAELSQTTEVFGGMAHRASVFSRSGVKQQQAFEVRGMIFLQCVRTAAGWRISAAVWSDQQPGQLLASHPEPTEFG